MGTDCALIWTLVAPNSILEVSMKVIYSERLDSRHSIEIGLSTWDETAISIRDSYDLPEGGFSPRLSSEFPLEDLSEILRVVLAGLPEVLRIIGRTAPEGAE